MTRKILGTVLLFCVYALVVMVISEVAIRIWGRPRGAAYGITIYYSFLGLCLQGALTLFVFRRLALKVSLPLILACSAVLFFTLFPGRGAGLPAYLAMHMTAMSLCLLFVIQASRPAR